MKNRVLNHIIIGSVGLASLVGCTASRKYSGTEVPLTGIEVLQKREEEQEKYNKKIKEEQKKIRSLEEKRKALEKDIKQTDATPDSVYFKLGLYAGAGFDNNGYLSIKLGGETPFQKEYCTNNGAFRFGIEGGFDTSNESSSTLERVVRRNLVIGDAYTKITQERFIKELYNGSAGVHAGSRGVLNWLPTPVGVTGSVGINFNKKENKERSRIDHYLHDSLIGSRTVEVTENEVNRDLYGGLGIGANVTQDFYAEGSIRVTEDQSPSYGLGIFYGGRRIVSNPSTISVQDSTKCEETKKGSK